MAELVREGPGGGVIVFPESKISDHFSLGSVAFWNTIGRRKLKLLSILPHSEENDVERG